MTNAQTTSNQNGTLRVAANVPDHAPMIVTRLAGWINVGEARAAAPNWIIPTRAQSRR